jgi:hypothetical protein
MVMSEELNALAEILWEAGWRSPNDAQWSRLGAAIPAIKEALSTPPSAAPVAQEAVAWHHKAKTANGVIFKFFTTDGEHDYEGGEVELMRTPLYAQPSATHGPVAQEGADDEMTEAEALRMELEWRDEKDRRHSARYQAYMKWSKAQRATLRAQLANWQRAYTTEHGKNESLAEKLAASEARVASACDLLALAVSDIEDWGAYAGDFFQHKHDLSGCIAKYRSEIAALSQPGKGE